MKYVLVLTMAILLGCNQNPKNRTMLDSADYNSKEERIIRLKTLVKTPTEVYDVEFKLFNVNGFSNNRTSIPGASSWNYKYAVKVPPAEVDQWVQGMIKMDIKYNLSWTDEIIQNRKDNWILLGAPEIYAQEGSQTTLLIYREEGILFKSIVQN